MEVIVQQCWVEFCGHTTPSTQRISHCPACQRASSPTVPASVYIQFKKVKGCLQLLMPADLRATERHLPHGTTECYLPDAG